MVNETQDQTPKLTTEELQAAAKMHSAIQDLQKAAHGTNVAMMLDFYLLAQQVEAMLEILVEAELVQRADLFRRVTERLEKMAGECRRAVLSAGGASALAGLRK